MCGINCRLIVCILAVLIIDNYLVGAGYTYIRTCGLSISQRLHCPQPSELLLQWMTILFNRVKRIDKYIARSGYT